MLSLTFSCICKDYMKLLIEMGVSSVGINTHEFIKLELHVVCSNLRPCICQVYALPLVILSGVYVCVYTIYPKNWLRDKMLCWEMIGNVTRA